MLHHTGQIDRGFHTGVATAYDGDTLALEQRAIAMRAVGHALVLVLGLTRHVDIAPARAGGEDHALGLQCAAIGQLHADQSARFTSWNDAFSTLQVHDVHRIVAHLRLHGGGKLGAVGLQHRDVVLDRHGVIDLATKALSRHAHAYALARGVDCRRRTGRATADDQHVKGFLGAELGGVALAGVAIELADDLFQRHAAGGKQGVVHEHHGHGHHLARIDLGLVHAAVDHGGADAGVEDGHERCGLHHVRAVVARQGHIDLEVHVRVQRLDLLQHLRLHLGWVAAGPQQGQHQRGELMAQRDGGKAHTTRLALLGHHKRGRAGIAAAVVKRHHVGQLGNLNQQLAHLGRLGAGVQRGDQANGRAQVVQIGLQLRLQGCFEHGGSFNGSRLWRWGLGRCADGARTGANCV